MHVEVELCALMFRLAGNVGTIDTSTWGGGELSGRSPPAKAKFYNADLMFYVTYASEFSH